jgi:hypothetical protein
MNKTVWRWTRLATLAVTVALACGSVAWGQEWGQYRDDDDRYRHDESRERGYRRGFEDGQRAGQIDAERGRRFHFKNDDWEDSRGFEHWMGNKGDYKKAYRNGYERGYRQAYGYGEDRGDRRHDHDDWR